MVRVIVTITSPIKLVCAVCLILEIGKIVHWVRVRMDLMESESNFSLMSASKGFGNIFILSVIKIFSFEKAIFNTFIFVSEMIKFFWWSWQLSSDLLFGPGNAILRFRVLRWIKVEFYWLSRIQICFESLFVGQNRHLFLLIHTR